MPYGHQRGSSSDRSDGVKGHGEEIWDQPEGSCPEMPKATKFGHCRFSLRAEKMNKFARNIIAYFVIALMMPIGALVLK